ncbi:MAG: DUF4340 domain-containing protein, partial [Peptococcaceae bacterium]|nr:DUF4340 domain-containing protein [Peptococcaceae bacterium]
MKKNVLVKNALVLTSLLILIACLSGALFILWSNPPTSETKTLSMLDNVEVLSFGAPIVEVAVTPYDGRVAFTVISMTAEGDADAQSSTLAGRDEFTINTSKTDAALASARRLESTRLLYEQTDDYTPFGLATPMASIQITDADGVSKTLIVGDLAPDKNNYYVQILGEPAIYLMPSYRLSY